MSRFGGGFPESGFVAAAASDDPHELEKANLVQAAFENTHNHLIGLAQAICELIDEAETDRDALSCLRFLKTNDVITEATRKALHDAQLVRSRLQHVYMDVTGEELHEAVRLVSGHVQTFIDDITAWLRQEGFARAAT